MCGNFQNIGWHGDSRYIFVEENIAMFFIALSHDLRNHFIKQRFNHFIHIRYIGTSMKYYIK